MSKISIITPCFNEEDNIELCRKAIYDLFEPGAPLAGYEREHIFSDNDSQDKTPDLLRAMAAQDPCVKVIFNARNFGPFRSNFNALRYATGDAIVVFFPADLQDPPDIIPEMVKYWEKGIEIVAGARATRDETFMLRSMRRLFYSLVRIISDFEIPENVGEFQLIDRKVWRAVITHRDHYPYIRGIIASTGFKRLILPYHWQARKRGLSKNNVFALIDQALNGIISFTSVPLRISGFIGFILAALSFLYAFFSFILTFIKTGNAPPGTQTIIVAIFFFAGVQLMFMGLLGEYVSSIHSQVRHGLLVVEREKINISDEDIAL